MGSSGKEDTMVADGVDYGKKNRNFERRNAQTSRRGWKPKQTSRSKLAKDIAASILAHEGREISDYTADPELMVMVKKALGG
jgi:hypothetical protein